MYRSKAKRLTICAILISMALVLSYIERFIPLQLVIPLPGIKLGIATSNSRELVENIAKVHDLHDYFSCIMTGCDILKGKPAPDIYLAVADSLQVKPQRCLVFEDIIPGIMAGKNAGMTVCAVDDAYSRQDRKAKMELADYFIEDYYDFCY